MSLLHDASMFSGLIAPIIDRTAISVHNAIDKEQMAALRGGHRFNPAALALIAGPVASGHVSNYEFAELTRYQHFGSSEPLLAGLAERGAITRDADGGFTATPDGTSVARQVIELQAKTVSQLFAPRQSSLEDLRSLIVRAQDAAALDPISPLARLMHCSWLPVDASDAARIWNASVVLRMHRSDAHAMAWQEAGRTAQEMRTLASGEARDAIERRTNELASTPWAALDPDERLTLLAGLGALPGTGSPI
jgi:hypothetical protein